MTTPQKNGKAKNGGASEEALSGIDVVFVLVASFTIVLFVLWLATALRGVDVDLTVPAAISGLVSKAWTWLAASAASVLLFFLKRAPGRKLLIWTVSLAAGFIFLVLAVSYLFLPPGGASQIPSVEIPAEDYVASLSSGHAIVYDGNTRYGQSGYSFSKSALVAWDSGEADILVENTSAGSGPAHFFLQYDTGDPVVSGASFDNFAKSGIVKVAAASLEEVEECPASGYETIRFQPEVKSVYCVRSRDGNHFAVINIVEIRSDRIAFDWLYQTKPSRRFS